MPKEKDRYEDWEFSGVSFELDDTPIERPKISILTPEQKEEFRKWEHYIWDKEKRKSIRVDTPPANFIP